MLHEYQAYLLFGNAHRLQSLDAASKERMVARAAADCVDMLPAFVIPNPHPLGADHLRVQTIKLAMVHRVAPRMDGRHERSRSLAHGRVARIVRGGLELEERRLVDKSADGHQREAQDPDSNH